MLPRQGICSSFMYLRDGQFSRESRHRPGGLHPGISNLGHEIEFVYTLENRERFIAVCKGPAATHYHLFQ